MCVTTYKRKCLSGQTRDSIWFPNLISPPNGKGERELILGAECRYFLLPCILNWGISGLLKFPYTSQLGFWANGMLTSLSPATAKVCPCSFFHLQGWIAFFWKSPAAAGGYVFIIFHRRARGESLSGTYLFFKTQWTTKHIPSVYLGISLLVLTQLMLSG